MRHEADKLLAAVGLAGRRRCHAGTAVPEKGGGPAGPAEAALGQIPAYLAGHTKDQGFSVLMILLKAVIGSRDELFFLLVAAFQMYCVMRFFRRCS